MLPLLNRRRAWFVLRKIDQILDWERRNDKDRDTRFVKLGRYLCELRGGTLRAVGKTQFIRRISGKTFPGDRPKAYYRMSTPVIEQATETAARMLGTDKSRGPEATAWK